MTENIDSTAINKESVETRTVPSVQVVLMREGQHGTEVFLGQRTAGGFTEQWGFPGGKIDEGESPERAACREAEEETGVKLRENDLKFLRDTSSSTVREKNGKQIQYKYDIKVYTAAADHLTPVNASPDEHAEMRWMNIEDALQMHDHAAQEAAKNGTDAKPDKIPGAIAPKTFETIKMLSAKKIFNK
jgi:8-oxo-dGTP pyrophosphatase MutT (NUDIX family)